MSFGHEIRKLQRGSIYLGREGVREARRGLHCGVFISFSFSFSLAFFSFFSPS